MTEHFEFTTDENGKVISMGGEKNESGWVFDEESSKNKGADLACKYGSGFNATSNQVFNMQIDSFIDGSLWQFHQCKAKHEAEMQKANEMIDRIESFLEFAKHEQASKREVAFMAAELLAELKKYREGK